MYNVNKNGLLMEISHENPLFTRLSTVRVQSREAVPRSRTRDLLEEEVREGALRRVDVQFPTVSRRILIPSASYRSRTVQKDDDMTEDMERLVGSLRVAGGRDRGGKPLVTLTTPPDLASFDRAQLDKSLNYVLSIFSDETRRKGLTFVVDAQKSNWRLSRLCVRHLLQGLVEEAATLIIVRPEAFWDKRVDNCTRVSKNAEPIYVPQSRVTKYIEPSQLTADLGGSLDYDHAAWLQDRIKAERFFRENMETQTELERVTKILRGAREGMNNAARTMTQTSATYNNTCHMANSLIQE
ncbi:hypothetical protein GE061_004425, partial [Apolygus lucorum]